MQAPTFVLVHGGGGGGWCWQPTARALRALGCEVYTPTLTGFGERSHLDLTEVTFETFVTDVVNLMFFEDLDDVVLVGHSMGGIVVPRVAEVVPDRIRRVVWLAAVVADDGESLLDAVPQSPAIARAVTIGPDGTAHTDPDLIIDANMQDGDAEQRAWFHDRHVPYPPYALTEPGRLSAFLALGLPTGYITASDDLTIEAPHTARFAARLRDPRLADVPGSHNCIMTQPDAVAAALVTMAT